ncbi:hypothetical protein H6G00_34020 [Leptolyngbya sp. FACHB-541]|uniref:hypothetical protein n=1 Tax=Leptolyngbya sp. FACHB-541 TaxID=2692810 RepID=UPI001683ED48|nr:hypothetical protein [Leptolyngbya sp. FACHB-541]MBD2001551.1 hypothetical protein [Leptolyngbya sp. FACHB-541]
MYQLPLTQLYLPTRQEISWRPWKMQQCMGMIGRSQTSYPKSHQNLPHCTSS